MTRRATIPGDAPEPESTGSDQGRDRGRFRRGTSGNPAGRPPGARHTALLALEAMGQENARALMQRVIVAALAGDMRACEMLLARLWPVRRGAPVRIALPPVLTAADLPAALAAVAAAVANAEISPEESAAVVAVLESQRKAFETTELEQRITELEKRHGSK